MIYIKKLSIEADINVYNMLQRIGKCENEFGNSAHGLTFGEFNTWLKEQDAWSKGENLPKGFVPQTIFWLYDDQQPIGIGKIREELTPSSRLIGGNIGYAIDPMFRNKGYATLFLELLVEKTKELGIDEILLTVEKYNPASKRVIEKAGGKLISETSERWYFEF